MAQSIRRATSRIPPDLQKPRNRIHVLILNAAEVRRALPMSEAVAAMKEAFAALTSGRAVMPQRTHLPVPRHAGVSLIMPAFVGDANSQLAALAVKVVSVFDNNQARGLARIQAAVLVLDPATGQPQALLEGATLTAIRTAAASGAATNLLAPNDARALAIFGAGVQARAHLEAMCAVRPIEEVRIYSRTPAKVAALIAEFTGRPGIGARLMLAASPREALLQADIVCATTTSTAPIFDDADLPAGVHINAVGSYMRDAREIPPETVRRAVVVVDSRDAAWQEAGDLIQPLEAGLIDRDHIHAELGEIVLGRKPGRTDERQITFFKSVGLAVQDAVAAKHALDTARRMGLGREVEW
jgi:ornithine cyclodeaminase/alanine dehydrogenase-like protein (mu-crystallin family)